MQTLILSILLLTNLILTVFLSLIYIKYRKLKVISQKSKVDRVKRREEILEEARKKSYEIVLQAYEKAAKVLGETESIDNKLKEKLKKAYEDAFSVTQGEVKNAIEKEIGDLKISLEKETFAGEAEVRKKLSQDYLSLEKELETYRLKKFEEADALAIKIAKDAVYKFLGKTISPEEHRDLVLKALEEAKKANIF